MPNHSDSGSDWDDDVPTVPAPKILMVGRVVRDYIPESNKYLTLFQDELVYVFKQSSDVDPKCWEGETRGEYGVFPPEYIEKIAT
ncbi:hypothetical protein H696_00639 [Fonticula alba]|uniref:SH3 domain-containing protein n=1 Tax=Fonticula alba TaxID=691883 RepID=A0A058ZFG4_FONAL|nr:hypothetical protein H696_00639 [Fonticula alba]KCV73094.1 hypothetical protein H696_00639 [Fonticula alba]|eukprot:XP_009492795.1 hypothetical protein H696_00639 [Fonticula alba]